MTSDFSFEHSLRTLSSHTNDVISALQTIDLQHLDSLPEFVRKYALIASQLQTVCDDRANNTTQLRSYVVHGGPMPSNATQQILPWQFLDTVPPPGLQEQERAMDQRVAEFANGKEEDADFLATGFHDDALTGFRAMSEHVGLRKPYVPMQQPAVPLPTKEQIYILRETVTGHPHEFAILDTEVTDHIIHALGIRDARHFAQTSMKQILHALSTANWRNNINRLMEEFKVHRSRTPVPEKDTQQPVGSASK
jgi:hypothetical protein